MTCYAYNMSIYIFILELEIKVSSTEEDAACVASVVRNTCLPLCFVSGDPPLILLAPSVLPLKWPCPLSATETGNGQSLTSEYVIYTYVPVKHRKTSSIFASSAQDESELLLRL